MSVASSRLPWLVIAIGVTAVIVGGVFVGRAVAGEDALSSWISAATGIVMGGCCVGWGARRARRTRRPPMTRRTGAPGDPHPARPVRE